jgi:AraC family transcriptional regulator of adaptative response / DNA-3-methyladenine glycosylase II
MSGNGESARRARVPFTPMPTCAPPPDDDARYRALKAHDARFDGSFFTGVTSTGIYCRPVCRVRTPRRENCRFFGLAAQAEQAGFRPCLRCRPELAPGASTWSTQDASSMLARQAARLLDDPAGWSDAAPAAPVAPAMTTLAARLGVSDRHLRRIFEAQLGVSPLQYLQTRRLLTAKQLLTDTDLPITRVALASGFASLRRFNAAFASHYGLNPTRLRREGRPREGPGVAVQLGYRPPYDVATILGFFARRQIDGVEFITTAPGAALFGKTVRLQAGGQTHTGWLTARFDETRHAVLLRISDSLCELLPLVITRVRALLDLDADPAAINAGLSSATAAQSPGFALDDRLAGLRLPGCLDGFELAVRAILGQQITVAAARTLGQRLVERFGEPLATPWTALSRLFPAPQVMAQASGDALGQLGIVRQRQAAIVALAQAVAQGRLALDGNPDVPATVAALKALPGIGDWTAQYIAMRALRWPDAFPAGDVALQKALGVASEREAERVSQAWKPWRSYAVVRAWHQGAAPSGESTTQIIANNDPAMLG